jgi:uncharacterized protein YndB with AHSA1/START domain
MTLNPKLDLTLTRIIKAPLAAVWDAWADPAKFAQWWLPAPMLCKVVAMDLTAGGAFETLMADPGAEWVPHQSACFLAVEPQRRIAFTNTLTGGWRPAADPFLHITGLFEFRDHPQGTEYVSSALHRTPEESARHEELGFQEGWGTVVAQLARLVERVN